MNETIEKFGSYLDSKIEKHPVAVRRALATAWSAIGFQATHFPSKQYASSREYLQGYTAKVLADMLRDSSNAAVVNIFMPCEIFHALDIPTTAPEALAVYIVNTAAERGFIDYTEAAGTPDTLCSFHKLLLGAAQTGVSTKPLLVANTTLACDANQLTFRELSEHWQVPHIILDVPYRVDEESVQYLAGQLKKMASDVEDIAHKKLSMEKLKACVARSQKTIDNYSKYMDHRAAYHLPEAMTPELLSCISNHIYMGNEAALKYSRLLLRDLKNAPKQTDRKKLLWMHVLPNWQESMKEIFQGDAHVEVLGCDLAYDNLIPMDPEKPFESMARRIVHDSYNGPGSRRIEATLTRAQKMKVDGIVIFCQWGCKQTQGIAVHAKKVFEENGFPTLVIDGDGGDRANGGGGQIVTRASAFVELLEQGGASC